MVRVPFPGQAALSCFLLSHAHTAFYFFWPQRDVFLGWVNLSSQQIGAETVEKRGKAIQILPPGYGIVVSVNTEWQFKFGKGKGFS